MTAHAPLRVLVCGGREARFMLALGVWAIAVAVGTADMVRQARAAGVRVREIEP
jgi:hypothetical protein